MEFAKQKAAEQKTTTKEPEEQKKEKSQLNDAIKMLSTFVGSQRKRAALNVASANAFKKEVLPVLFQISIKSDKGYFKVNS